MKRKNEDNMCGAMALLPASCWFGLNYIMDVDFDKLYGIKMKKILTTSMLLLGGHSLCYHFIRKFLK